jgi:hypothetical protein
MSPLPTINAIWIGESLGSVQCGCLRSFINAGHKVVLHVYQPPTDIPAEIELSDARDLLPESMIFRDSKYGSYAPFSDLLRYEILGRGLGVYVDCDVFCLKPIQDEKYIFGYYRKSNIGAKRARINCAVLKLPVDCPVLTELRSIRDGFIPPWYPLRERIDLYARRYMRTPRPLSKLGYQFAGPYALTYYLRRHGLEGYAKNEDVFHPITWEKRAGFKRDLLFDPSVRLADIITSNSQTVHLYSDRISRAAEHSVPAGSPLATLMNCASATVAPLVDASTKWKNSKEPIPLDVR